METQIIQPANQAPEPAPDQVEIAPLAEPATAGGSEPQGEPTVPPVEAPPEVEPEIQSHSQPQPQPAPPDALERLLAEAEARGYERGCQDATERLRANPPMWQPVDPSPSRFLSGLRDPVWPRD